MKRIFSMFAILTLLFSASINTFAATVPEGDESNIKVSYSQGETNPETIYSVEISWGSLEFNYNSGKVKTWNPETLKYEISLAPGETPEWTPVSVDGDKITVTNHSNTAICANVSYTKNAQNGVDGTVQNSSLKLATAVGTASNTAPTGTATLALSTSNLPSGFTEGATSVTVGSITVTITSDETTDNGGTTQSPDNSETPSASSTLSSSTVASDSLTGDGTEASPYLISDGADLLYLSQRADLGAESSGKYYKLEADIQVTADSWTPIDGFSGIFDGNGHTVSGGLHATDSSYGGLFASLSGTVKSLTVSATVSTTYSGGINIGGIAGYLTADGMIDNCTFSGTIQQSVGTVNRSVNAGGIAGTSYGTVSNCTNTGTVYGADANVSDNKYVKATTGGIVGWAVNGSVYGCTHQGAVIEGDRSALDSISDAAFYTGRIAGDANSATIVCACNTATTDIGFSLVGSGITPTSCSHS